MSQVSQVIYRGGDFNRTLNSPSTATEVWALMTQRFPELSNGTYEVDNGVMTISLSTGSKAV